MISYRKAVPLNALHHRQVDRELAVPVRLVLGIDDFHTEHQAQTAYPPKHLQRHEVPS
ncbi:hypothetical protein [Nitrococcus mobilis]|uniref:DNA polymerase IV n=1 Tax=Nitrococcus mobilis Nb-231 TaxID=314278 RepID=A4BTN6_9GAMM|nr:hypothetical protein [Nitrococcus mobilis]EAR20850.1 DNA polymerase IV [Nitrococcus mobilis Nb-231]